MLGAAHGEPPVSPAPTGELVEGQLEATDDATWGKFTQAFLQG